MIPGCRWMCAALAAAACGWTPAAQAGPAARYSLQACIRSGLERSTAVENAARDRATAEAVIGQTRAQVLPSLTARGNYLRMDELDAFDFDGTRMQFGRLDNYTGALELSQLLYNGGSVQAALRAARSYRDQMERAESRVKQTLIRDIRIAFHGVLFLEEAIRVQTEAVDQLRAFAEQAEIRYRSGAAAEFDALSARVRVANELPPLAAARRELGVARAAFRNLARLDEGEFLLEGALDYRPVEIDLSAALADAMAERNELEELRKVADLREADIRVERGSYAPEIRAYGSYEGRNPESFASSRDRWDWRWQAGLALEWSLFDGRLRESIIREKELALETALADLDEMKRVIALEVEQAVLELREADETVESARQTVQLAERNLEIAKVRFDTGLSTYLEFTDTNLAVRRARLQKLSALRGHIAAVARLDYATGRIRVSGEENHP